ncbi:hypothetical protein SPH9361_01658 [Sphingobium sp. CECT 9361]|nr:hypothetical protein SPH9361_01658 [Sphingobium sp. CECT 9361]|tara:strand:- start:340 stop:447 length:108 start_codon:yes stop_codon:yes gene_type:complete
MTYSKLQNAAFSLVAAFVVATVFVSAAVGPVVTLA